MWMLPENRDIKPANFVRKSAKETQFCIVDFGIAKLVSQHDIHLCFIQISLDSSSA